MAEEIGGLAGFREDGDRARQLAGVALDGAEVGVKACEDKDAAGGQLACNVGDEVEPVAARHDEVTEEEVGAEGTGKREAFFGGVARADVEAVLLKDQREGIGDHGVVVDDENALGCRFHNVLTGTTSISIAKL